MEGYKESTAAARLQANRRATSYGKDFSSAEPSLIVTTGLCLPGRKAHEQLRFGLIGTPRPFPRYPQIAGLGTLTGATIESRAKSEL